MVLHKNPTLSKQELIDKSMNYERAYIWESQIPKWAEEGKYILTDAQVEYGGEKDVEKLAIKLLKFSNFKQEDISFEWDN